MFWQADGKNYKYVRVRFDVRFLKSFRDIPPIYGAQILNRYNPWIESGQTCVKTAIGNKINQGFNDVEKKFFTNHNNKKYSRNKNNGNKIKLKIG